jgi:hypothetical protein
MKALLMIVITLLALLLWFVVFPPNSGPTSFPAPIQNQTQVKSISLLPSQRYTLINTTWKDVEVRSEYPLTVIIGPCQSDYTVQWHCSGEAHDIIMIDTRRVPVFLTPKANNITVTVKLF